MFAWSKSEPTKLDELIEKLEAHISDITCDDENYTTLVENLTKLHKLRGEPSKPISKDAILTTAGSILGILMILHYEKINIVTSKALTFVTKLR